MKKIILSAIMLIGLAFTAQAQDISKNALGLRFVAIMVLVVNLLTKSIREATTD
jgi:hypothetical protein